MAVDGFAVVSPTLQQFLFHTTSAATGTCFSHEVAMSWPGVKQLYVRSCANKRAKTCEADSSCSRAAGGEAKAAFTSRSSTSAGLLVMTSGKASGLFVPEQDASGLSVADTFPSRAPAQRTLSAPVGGSCMLLATDAFAPGTPPMMQLPAHPSSPDSSPSAGILASSSRRSRLHHHGAGPEAQDFLLSERLTCLGDPDSCCSPQVSPVASSGLLSAAFRRCLGSRGGPTSSEADDNSASNSSGPSSNSEGDSSPERTFPSASQLSMPLTPSPPPSARRSLGPGAGAAAARPRPASGTDAADRAADGAAPTSCASGFCSLDVAAAAAITVAIVLGDEPPPPQDAAAAAAADGRAAVSAATPSLESTAAAGGDDGCSPGPWTAPGVAPAAAATVAAAEPLLLPYDLSRSALWRVGPPRGRPPLPRVRHNVTRRMSLAPTVSSELRPISTSTYTAAADTAETPDVADPRSPQEQPSYEPYQPLPCSTTATVSQPVPIRTPCALRGGDSPFGRASGLGVPVAGWSSLGGNGCAADVDMDPYAQPTALPPPPVCWGGASWTRLTSPFAQLAEQYDDTAVSYAEENDDKYGNPSGEDGVSRGDAAALAVPRPASPGPASAPTSTDGAAGGGGAAAAAAVMSDEELDDYYLKTLCGGRDPLAAFMQREQARSHLDESQEEEELRLRSQELPSAPVEVESEDAEGATPAAAVAEHEKAMAPPPPPSLPPVQPHSSLLRADTPAVALSEQYGTLAASAAPPPAAAAAAAGPSAMAWEVASDVDVYDDDLFFELSLADAVSPTGGGDGDGADNLRVVQEAATSPRVPSDGAAGCDVFMSEAAPLPQPLLPSPPQPQPQQQLVVVTSACCDFHAAQLHPSAEVHLLRQLEAMGHHQNQAHQQELQGQHASGTAALHRRRHRDPDTVAGNVCRSDGAETGRGVAPCATRGGGSDGGEPTKDGWRTQRHQATAYEGAVAAVASKEQVEKGGSGGGDGDENVCVVLELERVASCVHCSVAGEVRRMVEAVVGENLWG